MRCQNPQRCALPQHGDAQRPLPHARRQVDRSADARGESTSAVCRHEARRTIPRDAGTSRRSSTIASLGQADCGRRPRNDRAKLRRRICETSYVLLKIPTSPRTDDPEKRTSCQVTFRSRLHKTFMDEKRAGGLLSAARASQFRLRPDSLQTRQIQVASKALPGEARTWRPTASPSACWLKSRGRMIFRDPEGVSAPHARGALKPT